MAKLIRNWEELAQVPANDTYKIIIGDCNGWIIPVWDELDGNYIDDFECHCERMSKYYLEFFDHHVYLSTHTFYGSNYKRSTEILQKHGFDVELDNWDKKR